MEQLVKQLEEKALTFDELDMIVRNKYPIVKYSDLGNYQSIEELVKGGIVLYYPIQSKTSGHYCALFLKDAKSLYYFDSYGLTITGDILFSEYLMSDENKTVRHYLPDLIQNFKQRGGTILINPYRFQSMNGDISTCGRHSAIRLLFKDLDHEQYNKLFKYKNLSNDDLITLLTIPFRV